MITIFAMSGCAVLAALITLSRVVGFKRLLGFGTVLDVAFSLVILAGFAGTLTGLLVATVSGLLMACVVTVCRFVFGYERPLLTWYRLRPSFVWIPQPRKLVWRKTA